MKRAFLVASGIVALVLGACKNPQNKEASANVNTSVSDSSTANKSTEIENKSTAKDTSESKTFDLNSIPVTDKFSGSFPYFKLPEGYEYHDPFSNSGEGKTKDYDREYFLNQGIYVPAEGKSFKADVKVTQATGNKQKEFSALEIQKSFDDLIGRIGGVKINNGTGPKEGEEQRLAQLDPKAEDNGYLHSCNNWKNVHTYVIRTADKTVWVQYNIGSDYVAITVLETKAFANEMSVLPASKIKEELDTKGKAVLYINFDVDKASLKPDGISAVNEIAKVLTENTDLNLSIEGHTDNTGNEAHNKQLSIDRAQTVMNELVKTGTNKSRLKATGYGSEKPLASNDSEEGKAKNRRVELIRLK